MDLQQNNMNGDCTTPLLIDATTILISEINANVHI